MIGRRGFLGTARLGATPPSDDVVILAETAVQAAEKELARIAGELAGLMAGQMPPDLADFVLPEGMTQVGMDIAETQDAVTALSGPISRRGLPEQKTRLAQVAQGLAQMQGSVSGGIPIAESKKGASIEHLKSHFMPIVEATAALAARIASEEGAAAIPIGPALEPPPPKEPSETVVEAETPWGWIALAVVAGAVVLSS